MTNVNVHNQVVAMLGKSNERVTNHFVYFQALQPKLTRKPKKKTSGDEDSSGETTDNLDDIDVPQKPVSRRLSDVSFFFIYFDVIRRREVSA